MKTSDLDLRRVRSIWDIAVLLYDSKPGGPEAVHDLARALRWEEYGPCEPCEDSNAPMLDGCCMACGSCPGEATP